MNNYKQSGVSTGLKAINKMMEPSANNTLSGGGTGIIDKRII